MILSCRDHSNIIALNYSTNSATPWASKCFKRMVLNANLFNLLWLLQTILSTALKQHLTSATHFTEGLESFVVATHTGNLLSNYVNRFK